MIDRIRIVRRATYDKQSWLPLGARSAARGVFDADEFEDDQLRQFAKVLWCVQGCATVWTGGRRLTLEPDHVAVFLPGTVHKAQAQDGLWEVRWWTIDGPLAEAIVTEFGFSAGVFFAGRAPEDVFDRLDQTLTDVTPGGEIAAGAIAYELLSLAAAGRPVQRDALVKQALTLIHDQMDRPELCVKSLSANLGIDRSALSRRFRSEMGIAPHEYLTRLRMQKALSLLHQSQLPIAKIALRCGYEDAAYFARLFRQVQRVTPRQYRRSQGQT